QLPWLKLLSSTPPMSVTIPTLRVWAAAGPAARANARAATRIPVRIGSRLTLNPPCCVTQGDRPPPNDSIPASRFLRRRTFPTIGKVFRGFAEASERFANAPAAVPRTAAGPSWDGLG